MREAWWLEDVDGDKGYRGLFKEALITEAKSVLHIGEDVDRKGGTPL
jgi:hypothetical protein